MGRVSSWLDRCWAEAGTNGVEEAAATQLESLLTSSRNKNLETSNALLSDEKRDVPSTSLIATTSSSRRSTNEKDSDEPLDSSLWSQLPESIIFLILACLPIHSLARFRLVCKRWQLLWDQADFLSLRISHAPQEKSWFIFNCKYGPTTPHNSHLLTVCFNPAQNRWHTLNFGPKLDSTTAGLSVVAASSGVMLCAAYDHDTTPHTFRSGHLVQASWFVCNPLIENCWLSLPNRPVALREPTLERPYRVITDPTFTSAGLIVDSAKNSFQVVLGTSRRTEIYSSSTGRWESCPNTLQLGRASYGGGVTHTISHKGFLICVAVSKPPFNFFPCSAVFYDPKEERWSQLSLPGLLSARRRLLSVQMGDCEGRLLLLVIIGPWTNAWSCTSIAYNLATPNPVEFEDSRLYIWEFVGEDLRSGEWREVGSHVLQEIRDLAVNVNTDEGAKLLAATASKDLICCSLTDAILSQTLQLLYSPFYNTWFSVEERIADERLFGTIVDFPEQNIRFQPRLETTAFLRTPLDLRKRQNVE